jgi:hypothetical protein
MKELNLFIGFMVFMLVGCILLVLVALTGSETFTYGLVGLIVVVSLLFLSSTNIFAQEK